MARHMSHVWGRRCFAPLGFMPAQAKPPEGWSEGTPEYKRIHAPWTLPEEEKRAAYEALLDCDWKSLILKEPGTQQVIRADPGYVQMLEEMRHDVLALDRAALQLKHYALHAAHILATDLRRRLSVEKAKPKPEPPPKSASEAKARAAKLFGARQYGDAADMYAKAIALLQTRVPVVVTLGAALSAAGEPRGRTGGVVKLSMTARARTEQQLADEEIGHTLYANLAACHIKQRRWSDAVTACDGALRLFPDNVKAVMRRATAMRMLKRWDEAVADARRAEALVGTPGVDKALSVDIRRQVASLIEDVGVCQAAASKQAVRQARDESGVTLQTRVAIADKEDVDNLLRTQLLRHLGRARIPIDEFDTNLIGMCKIEDDSPGVDDGELSYKIGSSADFMVEATVRSRHNEGTRALYYSIDVSIPWRGLIFRRGTKPEHSHHDTFRGAMRLFNITHATTRAEWRARLTEKPLPGEISTGNRGNPIQPLDPILPSGAPAPPTPNIDWWNRGRKLPDFASKLVRCHGPALVEKVFDEVEKAIAGLRASLGEERRAIGG